MTMMVAQAWCLAAAGAGPSTCEGSDVRIEGTPSAQWSEVLARTCADIASIGDRDPSATVRLIASEDDLVVEVVLADGRSALRRVTKPLALRSALEALLVLPPESKPKTGAEAPVAAAPSVPLVQDAAANAPPSTPPRSPATADLALSVAGRVAGSGYVSLAPAAEAYLVSGRWLLGLWARWDVFQHVSAPSALDFQVETVGAGLGVARRFDLHAFELDLGFSPRLLVESQSYEVAEAPPEDGTDDVSETSTDVRLALFGRALFGRGPFRFFTGLDAELSPSRLRRPVRAAPSVPALPAWSVGLSAGVSWTAP